MSDPKLLKRYRLARRVALILAAMPLLQLSQCATGVSQVFQTAANSAPSTVFSVLNSIMLLPLQYLLTGGNLNNMGQF